MSFHTGPAVAIQHFPLKLVSRRMLAPSVGHYTFVRDDGQPLDFIPGQFIQVHFQYADGTATKRSYSLATIHDHALGPGEAVEIVVFTVRIFVMRFIVPEVRSRLLIIRAWFNVTPAALLIFNVLIWVENPPAGID